jgi:hypothetical protein
MEQVMLVGVQTMLAIAFYFLPTRCRGKMLNIPQPFNIHH